MWARPSGLRTFEATFAVTFITARRLVVSPGETLSIGFRVLVSRHPAIQTTGLLTLAPAGLSPAEHASLRWTHNRTCGFPSSGFPTDFTAGPRRRPIGVAFVYDKRDRASGVSSVGDQVKNDGGHAVEELDSVLHG